MAEPLAELGALLGDEEQEEEQEAAAYLQEGGGGKAKSRRHEEQNPTTSFRLDPEINERLKSVQAELRGQRWYSSLSDIAAALLRRGLEAWDEGEELEIYGRPIIEGSRSFSRNGERG